MIPRGIRNAGADTEPSGQARRGRDALCHRLPFVRLLLDQGLQLPGIGGQLPSLLQVAPDPYFAPAPRSARDMWLTY
jgi:hypothetical protein